MELFKTEESKMIAIILSTLILQPIVLYFTQQYIVVIGLIILSFVILLAMGVEVILIRRKKLEGQKDRHDERSAQCSLRAARNAFVVCILLTAFLEIVGIVGKSDAMSRSGTLTLLIWIWQWGTGAYQLSYIYYLKNI